MTKVKWNERDKVSPEQLYETLVSHPYCNVARICMERKGIKDPTILHLILEYYEISKVDNKLNKGKRKNG